MLTNESMWHRLGPRSCQRSFPPCAVYAWTTFFTDFAEEADSADEKDKEKSLDRRPIYSDCRDAHRFGVRPRRSTRARASGSCGLSGTRRACGPRCGAHTRAHDSARAWAACGPGADRPTRGAHTSSGHHSNQEGRRLAARLAGGAAALGPTPLHGLRGDVGVPGQLPCEL